MRHLRRLGADEGGLSAVPARRCTRGANACRLLARSGLRVSPPALGAATFGTDGGWGAEQDEARKLFDRYVERGGNFIDTANTCTHGSSERLLGEFARDQRESLVLASDRPAREASRLWSGHGLSAMR